MGRDCKHGALEGRATVRAGRLTCLSDQNHDLESRFLTSVKSGRDHGRVFPLSRCLARTCTRRGVGFLIRSRSAWPLLFTGVGLAWVLTGFCPGAAFGQGSMPVYVIASQPRDQEVGIGGDATFTVSTSPSAGAPLQWLKNNMPITGAIGYTLRLSNVQPRDSGLYSVAVANLTGTIFSAAASLSVPPWSTVTTYAGVAGAEGAVDGPLAPARFSSPMGLAFDRSGNLYVADRVNCTIRKITPDGIVSTIAGSSRSQGRSDGPAASARFLFPDALAVGGDGTLYICDSGNHTVRKLTPDGVVSTLAGVAGSIGYIDGPGTVARFHNPHGVAVDGSDNVYVADAGNNSVRKITPAGVVSTLARIGAVLNLPNGIVADLAGNVFVSDTGNGNIRKITPAGAISVYAGPLPSGLVQEGYAGTPAARAQLGSPAGLALDGSGNLYVASGQGQQVHRIRPDGIVSSLAGRRGVAGQADGVGPAAGFRFPRGVAVDAAGKVYVADTDSHTLRVLTQAAFDFTTVADQPVDQSAALGGAVTLAVAAQGTAPFSYQWLKNGLVIAGATANPFVIAGAQGADSGVYSVVVTGGGGAVTSKPFTLTVGAGALPSFTLQPRAQTVNTRAAVTFSAAAIGPPAPEYQWTKNGVPIRGAITAVYAFTGALTTDAGDYAVIARNAAGATTSNVATLTVNAPPVITVQPQSQLAVLGAPLTLSVAATGTPAPTYTWRRNGAVIAGATGPTFTLPAFQASDAGTYTAQAANAGGSATSTGAIVTLQAVAPAFTRDPFPLNAIIGLPAQLSAIASGIPVPAYQWFKNGVAIPRATSNVLSIPSVRVEDTGAYTVTATNSAGRATSEPAALTVISQVPVAIVRQPVGVADVAGPTISLSVEATGGAPLTYQWRRNGVVVATTSEPVFRIDRMQPELAGLYSVVVSNASSSVTSEAVPVIVVTGHTVTTLANPEWAGQRGIVADAAGNIYLGIGPSVRKLSPDGVIATLPGTFRSVGALAVDRAGNVYVGEESNPELYKITVDGQVESLLDRSSFSGSVSLSYITGISVDAAGNIYIADIGNRTIVRRTPAGVLSIVAGAHQQPGYVDGVGSAARFNGPMTALLDGAGRIVVLDYPGLVRCIDASGAVTTIAGGELSGAGDGAGLHARFYHLGQGAIDAAGNIYVIESANHQVRKITPEGVVSTLAGRTNTSGFADGVGFAALFDELSGITVDPSGVIWVLDNGRLRKVSPPPGAAPAIVTQSAGGDIAAGQPRTLTVTASGGGPLTYQWLKNGVAIEGATGASYTLQPAQAVDDGTYVVLVTGPAGAVVTAPMTLRVSSDARLVNLACRLHSGTGADVLTAGFTLGGPGQKPVLVRGIGPSLTGFGVGGALPSTRLDLYAGSAVIASNAGWGGGAELSRLFTSVGAFPLAPDSADSAVVSTLEAGTYTVQVAGQGDATGIALMELYEAGDGSDPRLRNLSIRGNAGSGEYQLAGGFSIVGSQSATLLIRAIGPSLGAFGVAGTLPQPRLVISDSAGAAIAGNSGWTNQPQAGTDAWSGRVQPARASAEVFASVGAFALPVRSDDSALVVTLPPGTYNAQVSGENNTTGVVLLEVYELK